MKGLSICWGFAALVAILMKLFTYEFFLRDDQTCGIAIRSSPSLVSHQVLERSPTGTDFVLLQDEKEFAGSELYRALVSWGWIALLVTWPVLLLVGHRLKQLQSG